MKLSLVALGLGLAHLMGLAAAGTCPAAVSIKTRGKVVVGKNTTLAIRVANKGKKYETPITDGVLTVTLPPGFLYAAGVKHGGPQPSTVASSSGSTLTWSNLNLGSKRSQVFRATLSTNGCTQASQVIQASVASTLKGCTTTAKPRTVRGKYTPSSPTTCNPPEPPVPGCEAQGTFTVGVNNFQLIESGYALATDSTRCASAGSLEAIQGVNVYSFTAPSTGCYKFDTCGQIHADLAIAIVETCGDPSTQIECLDDTPECYYIGEEPDPGAGLAFSTNPVAMVGGKTYSVYLGEYCDEDDPADCGELSEDALMASTITISSVSC